jgi:hypothetical protein
MEKNPLKMVQIAEPIYREITIGLFRITEKTIVVHKDGTKEVIKIQKY